MNPKKKKFKVKYKSNVDFLLWEKIIEANDTDEAIEITSKKGKVLCIEEHSES